MKNSDVRVRDGAVARLDELAHIIRRWNRAVNLISRKDVGRLVSYHFADSLSVLPIVSPRRDVDLLDVGGGNGLPGLVLASACPGVRVLVRDGRKKRADFLEEACAAVGGGARFEIGRVDEPDFVRRSGESFDLIVARAVTRLRLLLKWCLPLLKPRGVLVAFKGSRCGTEVRAARRYFFANGGAVLAVMTSPWDKRCNPLRKFAIALKGD